VFAEVTRELAFSKGGSPSSEKHASDNEFFKGFNL